MGGVCRRLGTRFPVSDQQQIGGDEAGGQDTLCLEGAHSVGGRGVGPGTCCAEPPAIPAAPCAEGRRGAETAGAAKPRAPPPTHRRPSGSATGRVEGLRVRPLARERQPDLERRACEGGSASAQTAFAAPPRRDPCGQWHVRVLQAASGQRQALVGGGHLRTPGPLLPAGLLLGGLVLLRRRARRLRRARAECLCGRVQRPARRGPGHRWR